MATWISLGSPRGIYIGNSVDLWVIASALDPEPDLDTRIASGAEGVEADALGRICGAEVGR